MLFVAHDLTSCYAKTKMAIRLFYLLQVYVGATFNKYSYSNPLQHIPSMSVSWPIAHCHRCYSSFLDLYIPSRAGQIHLNNPDRPKKKNPV